MVGNGILWFSEYSSDEQATWTYGIFAIGNFAFQPKDMFPPSAGTNADKLQQ
jgi:hypothetical protein